MGNEDIMGSVKLVSMRQLAEARCSNDDWTGLRDQTERRRRQTRLALRSYRRRKAAQKETRSEDVPKSALQLRAKDASGSEYVINSSGKSIAPATLDLYIPPYLTRRGHIIPRRYLHPISSDHLLPLVEYNVYRATSTNVLILGLSQLNFSICRFGGSVPIFPNSYQSDSIPASLRRTALQNSAPYPDWIDILPSPRMRDNAVRTQHLFTGSGLCAELTADILGGLMGRHNGIDSGLRVWSNPWEPDGWELTEGFIKKWGFLVQGCSDLFESTNRWRDLRGEERLIIELK